MPRRIYLDHAATTPLAPEVREAMRPFLDETFGNPSSLHAYGKAARKAVDGARGQIATLLGAKPEELILTSGGTEADNLTLLGLAPVLRERGKHIVTSAIEHPAVLNPLRYLESQGWEITRLPVDAEGRVAMADLKAAIRPGTVLVSIMHGNNEVGTIQPIAEFGAYLREQGIPFHTDAVQTVGKLPIDLATLPVDYLTVSAHKLYGPKGMGALFVRESAPQPSPLLLGGGQEGKRRSGTENVAGIVGFAEALRLCVSGMDEEIPRLRVLQTKMIEDVMEQIPNAMLNGPANPMERVPGNVNFSLLGLEGEAWVLRLDMKGVAVSSGSACHSAVIEPSPVALALGRSPELAQCTVRFSLGRGTTETDVEDTVAALAAIARRLDGQRVPTA